MTVTVSMVIVMLGNEYNIDYSCPLWQNQGENGSVT